MGRKKKPRDLKAEDAAVSAQMKDAFKEKFPTQKEWNANRGDCVSAQALLKHRGIGWLEYGQALGYAVELNSAASRKAKSVMLLHRAQARHDGEPEPIYRPDPSPPMVNAGFCAETHVPNRRIGR